MVTLGVTDKCCNLSRLTLQGVMDTISKHPLIEYAANAKRTLEDIAKEADCSRMTLYRLMAGEQNATIGLLQRVSAATGGKVPVSAFLPSEVVS